MCYSVNVSQQCAKLSACQLWSGDHSICGWRMEMLHAISNETHEQTKLLHPRKTYGNE